MPRVPEKENFEVGVQPFSAHFNDTIHLNDNTRWYRDIADGLMIGARFFKERKDQLDKTDALYAAANFQETLDQLQYSNKYGFKARMGKSAYENDDGTSVYEEYQKRVADAQATIGARLKPDVRKYFDQHVLNAKESFNRSLVVHQAEQQKQWMTSVNENFIKKQIEQFALNVSTDPDGAVGFLNSISTNVRELGRLNGWSAEETRQRHKDYISTGLHAAIGELAENGELDKANQMFNLTKGHMKTEDIFRTRQVLTIKNDEALGLSVGNATYAEFHKEDGDLLVDAMRFGESNNNNYDKNGNLLKSPKGALAASQVMPATLKDPGFGIKPAKDLSPAEINRVGREYLNVMLRRYDGDVNKALAAYNWGFANVDNAVKEFKDKWFDHVPSETKDYVPRVLKKFNELKAGRDSSTKSDAYSVVKSQKLSSRAEKVAIQAIDNNYKQAVELKKDNENSLLNAAYQALIESNGDITKIPTAVKTQLPDKMDDLYSFAAKMQKGVEADDPYTYNELLKDDNFLKMSDPDFLATRSKLSQGSWEYFAKRRAQEARPGRTGFRLLNQTARERIDQNLTQLGINTHPPKSDTEANARLATLQKYIYEVVDSLKAVKGRDPTPEEVRGAVDKAMMQTANLYKSFLGMEVWSDKVRVSMMTIDDIPDDTKEAIIKDLRNKVGNNFTDDEVVAVYLKKFVPGALE